MANNALAANGELTNVDNAAKVGNALLKQQNSPFELKAEDNQLKWTNKSEVDEKTSDKLSGAVATVTVEHQSDSPPQETQNVESVNQRTLAAGADYTNSLAGKDLYLLGMSLDKAAMAHLDPKLVDKNKPEEERIALFEQYERENSYSFHQLKNALVQTQDSKNTKAQSKVANDDHLTLDVSEFHHERINHSEIFAERENHINGIENFWSQAKRALRKYNGINRKNFPLFLKECEFRFNVGTPKMQLKTLRKWCEI